ncbi:hypothetical protein ACRRTK_011150 [Alexandromys fortis]
MNKGSQSAAKNSGALLSTPSAQNMVELKSCLLMLIFISTDFTHSVLMRGFEHCNEKMHTLVTNLNCDVPY